MAGLTWTGEDGMSSEEWDATYRAEGELTFAHELGGRHVVAPELFHGRMSHHPGEDHSLRFGSYLADGLVMGFILDFRDPRATKLSGFTVIHPRYGGVSTTYGVRLRRPLKWTAMDVGSTATSGMDDLFDIEITRVLPHAWEVEVEAQNQTDPPFWLTSGVFRLELSSLDRPWRGIVASFVTKATRQSGRGRIELTMTERGLVYPGYGQS